ncbi:uncharacterized protein N7459_008724 [Penicillium hispanicum]|uniref:uncharacterized protein n=1 Tax=Penicillium hispanicum TaxID=1080232 RepID=UPI0025404812|nr:uncharacterized protein N7459_008724 [Penicillium hispanicum]KAJ5574297.1 hypothetical protein N7459_008724 [Penicillium hispanicum]
MTSSRPLLIPQKRPLLSPSRIGESNRKSVHKILNPSAVAAETRMKKANPYTLHFSDEDDEESTDQTVANGHELDNQPARIEVSFAMPPQPFLDPSTWEAMLNRARRTATALGDGSSRERQESQGDSEPSETPDQRRQRRDREAEYGSMAIRGRSNVGGRGRRGRRGRRETAMG